MLFVTPELQIPSTEFEFSFARSSGPGGQNVNKVNSKVILRWHAVQSPSLSIGARLRFMAQFGSRLTSEGALIITSDRFRDQARNREDCLEKLKCLLLEIVYPPKPRKKTKLSRSKVEKRKNQKKQHGEKKRMRGRVGRD